MELNLRPSPLERGWGEAVMKDYTTISRIYFIGIGGIGMSALAKYYLSKNASVSGYDKTVTTLTKQMENEGINIHYEDNIDLLDKNAQLIVYTPAVPKDHKELNYYLHNNYEVIKRSALLGEITKSIVQYLYCGHPWQNYHKYNGSAYFKALGFWM